MNDQQQRDNHDVSLEVLAKIAALFGLYLLVQGYGYQQGLEISTGSSSSIDTISLIEAVSLGGFHMKNFISSWSPYAWPLSPFLCGILLLYAPYLPTQIYASNRLAQRINAVFFAVYLSVSTMGIGAAVFTESDHPLVKNALFPLDSHLLRIVFNLGYLMLMITLYLAWYRIYGTFVSRYRSIRLIRKYPYPEILTSFIIISLLCVSYFGSLWDGAHDGYLEINQSVETEFSNAGSIIQNAKPHEE